MASTLLRTCGLATAALIGVSGCSSLDRYSKTEGALAGAGAGALAGAALSGGVLLPVLGGVGGAVMGSKAAEPDPPGGRASDTVASTDGASSSSQDLFARLDDDGNGTLDATEAADSADFGSDWQRVDRNGDGRIDRGEFDRR